MYLALEGTSANENDEEEEKYIMFYSETAQLLQTHLEEKTVK